MKKNKLTPTKPLDLSKVSSVGDLVEQMSHTAFGGRSVGEAAEVLYKMARDRNCYVVLTLSGAMTVAKMGLVICDLIDNGIVQAVVSTGAILAHGLVETRGMKHFKFMRDSGDSELYRAGYDRIYDTLESEKNLDAIYKVIFEILKRIPRDKVLSSRFINEEIGKFLADNTRKSDRGILKSAYLKKVPVYVPAFTDSELGLDVAVFNRFSRMKKKPSFTYDPFLDLEDFTSRVEKRKKLGIFIVGGGVPRNWSQQVGPYLDILKKRLGKSVKIRSRHQRYAYGVRICPEPVYWGGLSGCTFSEGVSWGKFVPPEEGGMWAEVYADATIAMPLIVKSVLERLKKR